MMEGEHAAEESPDVLWRAGKFQHPDSRQLERFMRGELPRDEARAVVRHLLRSCPRCIAVTRRLWQIGDCAVLSLTLIGAEARRADGPFYTEPL